MARSTLCLITWLSFNLAVFADRQHGSDQAGTIRGVVFDEQQARIISSRVTIENSDYKNELRVNDAGEFALSIAPGTYEVIVHAPWFFPYRRKSVTVSAGKTVELETTLFVRPTHSSCGIFDSFVLKDISGLEDHIDVSSAEQSADGEVVEYRSGQALRCGDVDVKVRYGKYQLTADKVILNHKTFRLEANGNVMIDDGKERKRLERVTLTWNKKIVSIHRPIFG